MKFALRFLALAAALFAVASPAFAQPQTETVVSGSSVTLTATADGSPAPTFEWFRGTTKVGDGPTLTFASITAAQAGVYTVRATNIAGSAVSDPVTLVLAVAPSKPSIKITSAKPNPTLTVTVPPGTRIVTAQ